MTPARQLNPRIVSLLRARYSAADLAAVRALLDKQGTLRMASLPSGLFSAASITNYSKGTNYHAAWVRDNVHVAYAHYACGQQRVAVKTALALGKFFATQRDKMQAIIDNPNLKTNPQHRPHVRFDGDNIYELDQPWSHSQNDALGYFVWLTATLVLNRVLPIADLDIETLALFPKYFQAIEFWADEDSGHWEEVAKVSASSIGAVVAGLKELREVIANSPALTDEMHTRSFKTPVPNFMQKAFSIAELDVLLSRGEEALRIILPAECIQPDPAKNRPVDAALEFLIYPLGLLRGPDARRVVRNVEERLLGSVGISRYRGDSFYCEDYETLMAQRNDDPTRDFSRDLPSRDTLLKTGGEAQWCIFDSILSVIYGRWYMEEGNPEDLRRQTVYLNRALMQVTDNDPPRCEAFACPELYYLEQGKWQTSKSTPLLWAQANLWTALTQMDWSISLA